MSKLSELSEMSDDSIIYIDGNFSSFDLNDAELHFKTDETDSSINHSNKEELENSEEQEEKSQSESLEVEGENISENEDVEVSRHEISSPTRPTNEIPNEANEECWSSPENPVWVNLLDRRANRKRNSKFLFNREISEIGCDSSSGVKLSVAKVNPTPRASIIPQVDPPIVHQQQDQMVWNVEFRRRVSQLVRQFESTATSSSTDSKSKSPMNNKNKLKVEDCNNSCQDLTAIRMRLSHCDHELRDIQREQRRGRHVEMLMIFLVSFMMTVFFFQVLYRILYSTPN